VVNGRFGAIHRFARILSLITFAATLGLLVLGAVVTSFRVGMADPIWPTEPWRLALIDWREPDPGFIVEHVHRLAGFSVGALMSALALSIWFSESDRKIRWLGLASLAGLLVVFGWLHGVLIRQTKLLPPGSPLSVPPAVAGALAVTLLAAFIATGLTAARQSVGWLVRVLSVALLVGVMLQGLLGGLRVHLNAMFGDALAATHGSFAQIVFGLLTLVTSLCWAGAGRRHEHEYHYPATPPAEPPGSLLRVAAIAAAMCVFLQIVAGAVLRHTMSPLGGRLHLIGAFAATVLLIASCHGLWRAGRARPLVAFIAVALTAQIALGVESWLSRFGGGFAAAPMQRITVGDAALRTAHAVTGYLLWSGSILLAVAAAKFARRARLLEVVV
jgi:heme A synthase